MSNREILVRLKAKAEEFSAEVNRALGDLPARANQAGQEAGDSFASGFKAKYAAIGAAAGGAVTVIAQAVRMSTELARDIDVASKQMGVNAETLQEWRYAASQAGMQAGELDDNITQLTRQIGEAASGNRKVQQSFVDLGLSFSTLDGRARGTEAVFVDLVKRMSEIQDPAERARLGAALVGDEFNRLEPLLALGAEGFRRVASEATQFGYVLSSEELRSLNQLNGELERMKTTLQVDIAEQVARNSGAIIGMANALGQLAGMAISAANAYTEFKLRQGAAEAGLNGAVYGFSPFASDQAKSRQYKALNQRYLDQLDNLERGPDTSGSFRNYNLAPLDVRVSEGPLAPPRVSPKPIKTRSGGGGASRGSRASGPSKEEREREREIEASREYAEALERESDRIGKTSIELKQMEVAAKAAAAPTDALRLAIIKAGQEWEEAFRAQADADFEREVLNPLENELRLIGLVGAQRERASLALEEQAFKAEAAAKGITDVNAAWERYVAAQSKIIDAKQAEDQLRDLSGLYEDLFTGGTGRIWKDFKAQGARILSEIAAQYTLALLSGQPAGNVGQMAGAALAQSPLGVLFSRTRAANDNGARAGGGITVTRGGGFGLPGLPSDQDLPGDITVAGIKPSLMDQAGVALASMALAQIVGGKGGAGGQIGGGVGAIAGSVLGGPLGAVIGSVLGSLIGGMFGSTKRGSATIGGAGGSLGLLSTQGNSGSRIQASSDAAGSVMDNIARIAEALGGDVNASVGKVSIGLRRNNWRIDPTGSGATRLSKGAIDFGSDQEAAVRAAISDLIADNVITGISDASARILKSGKDLETAIEQAVLIESVPKLLKQRLDPLGAQLDELDDKYRKLAEALKEGGASAEQIAQARQLWQLEREDTVRQIGEASATLKGFLSSLTVGSNSPYSVRRQYGEAQGALSPYLGQIEGAQAARAEVDRLKAAGASAAEIAAAEEAARIAAGKVDQEGFQNAAQTMLSLSRSMNASGGGFFADFNRIKALTGQAIGLVDGAVPAPGAGSDPFAQITASNTTDVVNLLTDTNALLKAINDNMATGGNLDPAWLAQLRNFA